MITDYEKIHRILCITNTRPSVINSLFSFFDLEENNNIKSFKIIYKSKNSITSINDFFQEKYILQFNSQYLANEPIICLYNDLYDEIIKFCFGYYDEIQNKDINVWNICYDSFINNLKQHSNINFNLLKFTQEKDDKLLPQQKYSLIYNIKIYPTYNWPILLSLAYHNKLFISTYLENLEYYIDLDFTIKSINRNLNQLINNYTNNCSYFVLLFYFMQYMQTNFTITNFSAILKKLNQSNISVNVIMQILIFCMQDINIITSLLHLKEWQQLYNSMLYKSNNIKDILINNLNYSFSQLYDDF